MICASATAGFVSSTLGAETGGSFKASALLKLENTGEITSRKARIRLAPRCRGLILWKIILV